MLSDCKWVIITNLDSGFDHLCKHVKFSLRSSYKIFFQLVGLLPLSVGLVKEEHILLFFNFSKNYLSSSPRTGIRIYEYVMLKEYEEYKTTRCTKTNQIGSLFSILFLSSAFFENIQISSRLRVAIIKVFKRREMSVVRGHYNSIILSVDLGFTIIDGS